MSLTGRSTGFGLEEIQAGTVYPALARLERERRVSSRLVASGEGPARKYYRPTRAGLEALDEGTARWRSLVEVVSGHLDRPIPRPAKDR